MEDSTFNPDLKNDPVPDDDAGNSNIMLAQVYDELRRLAAATLNRQQQGITILQPTALVHELYLRLAKKSDGHWQDRTHFLAVAAKAMRQILIDHARKRNAAKRGGHWQRVTLSESVGAPKDTDVDLICLNDALEKLTGLHERQAQIVELRFLAGLTVQEVARVLEVSEETVKVDWRMARAWLMKELSEGG